jgi:predicted transcriptional regulator
MAETVNDATGEVDDGGKTEEESHASPLRKETVFEMLGNERRRHVIDLLREEKAARSLDSLAKRVAARENDTTVDALAARERKRVYTSLQQTHLPKMDDAGILAFDKNSGTVTPSERLTEYTLHLDVASTSAITTSGVYLGLSVLGVGIFVLRLVGAPLVDQLPALGVAAVVVGLFGGTAAFVRYVHP